MTLARPQTAFRILSLPALEIGEEEEKQKEEQEQEDDLLRRAKRKKLSAWGCIGLRFFFFSGTTRIWPLYKWSGAFCMASLAIL